MDLMNLGKLICGTLLIVAGGAIWAFTGVDAAGSAMIGAGATMLPGAIANARSSGTA